MAIMPNESQPTGTSQAEAPELQLGGGSEEFEDTNVLAEKKRRYSIDLYQYTNDQWQGVRKAIEESARNRPGDASSLSSQSSPTSSEPSESGGEIGNEARGDKRVDA